MVVVIEELKGVIKLINVVAERVNNDPDVNGKLKVVLKIIEFQ